MHQLKNKTKIYFYILSFIFLTTIINKNFFHILNQNFLIEKIKIQAETNEIKEKIINKSNYVLNKNIFLINKKELISIFDDLNFIEKIQIKKQYPKTINIKVKITDLIAITFINREKFYLGLNGQFISTKDIEFKEELPVIFGKFNIKNYLSLKDSLKQNNINHKLIIRYYFHKNNRWDLYFKNDVLLKLPESRVGEALKIYNILQNNENIKSGSIVDLRIINKAIISNE